ncbi:MAG: hypothetical protein JAY64_10630 [Candidatus Thiodiazotropha weberae]|nr:hypothetical protein [Candidatus Thiodiazotropha lotti]MCG8012142.1 hypothetical protein [Candidatus Thiodiazotropha lotti]MCW4211611.1 hypothetical protein [Candidatus Thiodiazotropha lotti]MCW4214578.1 hypothetical protein [Candidatus Thiodiazotropha lotti]
MNTITQSLPSRISRVTDTNTKSSENSGEFSYRIDKLKDSLSTDIPSKEDSNHMFLTDISSCEYDMDKLDNKGETDTIPTAFSQQNETKTYNNNSVSQTTHTSLTTASVNSIQELSSHVDKHLLNSTSNKADLDTWRINYSDNYGVKIDFNIKRINKTHFSLSCNIDLNNIKSHILELNDRLSRKGWSIHTDTTNNYHKITKVTI